MEGGVPGPGPFWLVLQSRNYWDGKFNKLNFDSEKNSGLLDDFNLDPEDALAIAFLEPVVTEKDGEWIVTVKRPIDPKQRVEAALNFADWTKRHPGPKWPSRPKNIRYPEKIQKRINAWEKDLKAWQVMANSPGVDPRTRPVSPRQEDYLQLTPEEKKQYDLWKRKEAIWIQTGEGNYPQPIDYIKTTP